MTSSTSPDAARALSSHPERQPQAQALSAEALAWLAALPSRYQPLATARRHPHVVNRLCELWATPEVLPGYMRELVLSTRPGRRSGFGFEVLTELADLWALVEETQQARP